MLLTLSTALAWLAVLWSFWFGLQMAHEAFNDFEIALPRATITLLNLRDAVPEGDFFGMSARQIRGGVGVVLSGVMLLVTLVGARFKDSRLPFRISLVIAIVLLAVQAILIVPPLLKIWDSVSAGAL